MKFGCVLGLAALLTAVITGCSDDRERGADSAVTSQRSSGEKPSGSVKAASGSLRVEPRAHDWGRIPDTDAVKHTFTVVNETDHGVVIEGIKSPCGCLRATATPSTLPPGSRGEIVATYAPQGRQGKDHKVLTVMTSPPLSEPLTLDLTVEVAPLVAVEPRSLWLGEVPRNTPAKAKEIVVITREATARLMGFRTRDERFSITPVASEDAEDHGERVRRHVYDVGFSGSPDAGRTTAQLVLETDLPSHARIFVNCYVSVIGPVWVSPDILSLGRLPAGEAFEKTITVRHREGGPLRILDTRAEGPEALGLSVSPGDPDPRMPGSTRFVVEGTANRPAGAQPGSISRVEGVIVLSTSLADQPEVRITFNGWIVPEP